MPNDQLDHDDHAPGSAALQAPRPYSIIRGMPRSRRLPGEPPRKSGPKTRFPNKSRTPFALCLPPSLNVTLQRTADRLQLKRGDVICYLIQEFADKLNVA